MPEGTPPHRTVSPAVRSADAAAEAPPTQDVTAAPPQAPGVAAAAHDLETRAAAVVPARVMSTAEFVVDRLAYVVGIIGPVSAIPQLITIWSTQSAEDVSVLSYVGFVLTAVVWLAYGIIHRTPALILSNTLWIIFEGGIVVGAVIYGGDRILR